MESKLADGILERWLADEDALARFVSGFLECRIAMTDWTHRAHVGVAAALVLDQGEGAALETLRVAIPRFNVASGGANTEVSRLSQILDCVLGATGEPTSAAVARWAWPSGEGAGGGGGAG